MLATATPRALRGNNLLELCVVLVVLGILGAAVTFGYTAVSKSADSATAEHTLRTVITAEQLRFESRGAFSDDPVDLAKLEPAWQYLSAAAPATSHKQVSVSVGRHSDIDAVSAATSSGDTCLGVVVYDPAVGETLTATWPSSDGPCNAAAAFTRAGVDPW